ncbi:hypothetical protein BGK38_03125 [Corynebacterium diphtheriae]|nr:DUF1801 domain-containing protein [Corynebacterium diphtheriae]ODS19526.1 hypothetical protein BGK38_03125 [Corynebacterium diphtheriae]ONF70021.1 hypothetical protein BXA19_05530 [Corynebacterium diphtheriae]RNF51885.1 iron chaperone [Corynebacterium diphtheriae]
MADGISNPTNRAIAEQILAWVHEEFPDLGYRFAWKQPMFTHHGTFIIGFSPATNHISFAPERAGIVKWEPQLKQRGLSYGKMMVRLPWDQPIPFDLLRDVIAFNIDDKRDVTSFWRK